MMVWLFKNISITSTLLTGRAPHASTMPSMPGRLPTSTGAMRPVVMGMPVPSLRVEEQLPGK